MIIIRRIDTFRDGGSIGIDAWISSTENIRLEPNFPLITIDKSFPDGDGSWYNGWKKDGGMKIEDEEFKAKVIEAIEKHISREQQILNIIKEKELDEKELFKLYMEWVNKISEDCDWKTHFTPEEIVGAIVRILESNPHLIKTK